MKRFFAYVLSLALLAGMTVQAFAVKSFTDVSAEHWAYSAVYYCTENGIVYGMGDGSFAPSAKLRAVEYLAMIERVVYAEDIAADTAQPEDEWYSCYYRVAEKNNLLNGTKITAKTLLNEISRFDMAQILYQVCHTSLGIEGTVAETNQVADYNSARFGNYANAVLWCYGTGLLKGDEKGRFNGEDSLSRAEAAVVSLRSHTLVIEQEEPGNSKPGGSIGGGSGNNATPPETHTPEEIAAETEAIGYFANMAAKYPEAIQEYQTWQGAIDPTVKSALDTLIGCLENAVAAHDTGAFISRDYVRNHYATEVKQCKQLFNSMDGTQVAQLRTLCYKLESAEHIFSVLDYMEIDYSGWL